jgi:membrane protease YdiL (CAAX protease family)
MDVIQAILQILTAMVISIILSVLAMNAIKLTGADLKDMKQRNRTDVLIIASIFNLLFIVAVGLLLKFWNHASIAVLKFSLNKTDIAFLIIALVFSISFALLYIWYLNRKQIIITHWVKKYFSNIDNIFGYLLGFIVLFIAALQEEILFRGYMAYILVPFGFYYALFISALLFTFWHYLTNKVNFFQTLDWFIGGIMLFLIYWFSGSIWVAAIVHFSRNFINVIIFNISSANAIIAYNKPVPPKFKTIYTITNSIVLILIFYFYSHLYTGFLSIN